MNKRRLEELLYENNMSQQDLAQALNITAATLSRNLNGLNEPRADLITNIASYFNVSTDWLLGLSNTKTIQLPSQDDPFLFALYGETKDLSEDQKNDLLDLVKSAKKMMTK